jgi:hypothetical protein
VEENLPANLKFNHSSEDIGSDISHIKNSLTKKTLKNQGNTEKMIL